MWSLNRNINEEEEHDFHLKSKDFYRPPLKQIGNCIYEIKAHYMSNGHTNFAPSECTSHLAGIRDRLLTHLEDDSFLYKKNIVTGSAIPRSGGQEGPLPSLVVLMDSLALAMDFEISPRPNDVLCDILLVICGQPAVVLTLVDGDKDSETVTMYNTSVGTGVTSALYTFSDESINIVCGVLNLKDIETLDTFRTSVSAIAEESGMFVTSSSFTTSPSKYEKILTAFWAGVAKTRSVISRDGRVDADYLRFLTKDQCIILMENINNRVVEVQFQNGTGATTLMIEVARRLSRLEDTLLVSKSKEEKERIRSVFLDVKTAEDLTVNDLSRYTNIVDETGTLTSSFSGKIWKFIRSYTETERLENTVKMLELENFNREKIIYLFASDDRQEKFQHLSREFKTLKLFDISFKGLLSAYHLPDRVALEILPVKNNPSDERDRVQRTETEDYVRHVLDQLKRGIRERRDLFPLLGDMARQVKVIIPNLQAKLHFLELATETMAKMEPGKSQTDPAVDQDIRRMEDKKHGVQSDRQLITGSTELQTTEVEELCLEQGTTRTSGLLTVGGKPGQTQVVADEDAEIAELKKRIETLELEAGHKKQDLAELREDHGSEWGYNMDRLAEEMSTLKIQDIVTDVIGEDQLPVISEKQMKLPVFSDDCSTRRREKTRSQVHLLRVMQYGRLNDTVMMGIMRNVITDDQSRLSYLRTQSDRLEHIYGSPVHIVGKTDTDHSGPVSCPPMTLDRERVDEELAVSGDGLELVNTRGSLDQGTDQMKMYEGTCSRQPIPLPLSLSTLTVPRYWETHSRVQVKGPVSRWWILDMAVSREWKVDRLNPSWSVGVENCRRHPGHICTKVFEGGRQVGKCLTDTMSPTPGTDVTLIYGAVLDIGRGRLAFIDVNRGRVLHKFDLDIRESLLPMFSTAPFRLSQCDVAMRLVSGREIAMTDEKKGLIATALYSH